MNCEQHGEHMRFVAQDRGLRRLTKPPPKPPKKTLAQLFVKKPVKKRSR